MKIEKPKKLEAPKSTVESVAELEKRVELEANETVKLIGEISDYKDPSILDKLTERMRKDSSKTNIAVLLATLVAVVGPLYPKSARGEQVEKQDSITYAHLGDISRQIFESPSEPGEQSKKDSLEQSSSESLRMETKTHGDFERVSFSIDNDSIRWERTVALDFQKYQVEGQADQYVQQINDYVRTAVEQLKQKYPQLKQMNEQEIVSLLKIHVHGKSGASFEGRETFNKRLAENVRRDWERSMKGAKHGLMVSPDNMEFSSESVGERIIIDGQEKTQEEAESYLMQKHGFKNTKELYKAIRIYNRTETLRDKELRQRLNKQKPGLFADLDVYLSQQRGVQMDISIDIDVPTTGTEIKQERDSRQEARKDDAKTETAGKLGATGGGKTTPKPVPVAHKGKQTLTTDFYHPGEKGREEDEEDYDGIIPPPIIPDDDIEPVPPGQEPVPPIKTWPPTQDEIIASPRNKPYVPHVKRQTDNKRSTGANVYRAPPGQGHRGPGGAQRYKKGGNIYG